MEHLRKEREEVYSAKIRAGKRTYFFDVKATRSNDYYITITESKRRFGGDGYDKHKIFLYKEDFNKFVTTLNQTIDHIKTHLLPDYDYDEFNRDSIVTNDGDENSGGDSGGGYENEAEFDDVGTSWDE